MLQQWLGQRRYHHRQDGTMIHCPSSCRRHDCTISIVRFNAVTPVLLYILSLSLLTINSDVHSVDAFQQLLHGHQLNTYDCRHCHTSISYRKKKKKQLSSILIVPTSYMGSSSALQVSLNDNTLIDLVGNSGTVSSIDEKTLLQQQQITTIPTYEPVLDISALFVFTIIMSMFVLLQYRIRQIDAAYAERNVALQKLRTAKAMELSNSNSTFATLALQQYNTTYQRIEELRSFVIIPGIYTARILVPPSPNNNDIVQMQHELAAQQYLGINTSNANTNPISSQSEQVSSPMTSTTRTVVLGIVALTQIMLFVFLLLTDPMMSSTTMPL